MDMFARLDPELMEPLKAFNEVTGGGFDLNNIPATRAVLRELHAALAADLAPIEGVSCELGSASVPGGTPNVPVRIFRPDNMASPLPALLWIHGGGYVLSSAEDDDIKAKQFALSSRCIVVSVDYRLAPEFPYPAPLEDCYTALKWLWTNHKELGADASRIAIGGASAGGGLAAGLSLLARDRNEIKVLFQLLIYPMIDDMNIAPASDECLDTFIWSRQSNRLGWTAYLGSLFGKETVPSYAAPFRAMNLSGLPPAYMPVGDLDLFLYENMDYARRLLKAGVPTKFHVYPGAYHGFEGIGPDAFISKRFIDERDSVLLRVLHG